MSEQQEFYTAAEARKVLGLTEATFFYRVNQGQIPRVIPRGRRLGVYPKKIIDALAQAQEMLYSQHEHLVFSRSTLSEQEQEMHIGIKCFGPQYITPLAERIAFQLKNGYTFWSLKVDGQVVGYISLFRFPPDFQEDILTGAHIERDITVREVLPFERGKSFAVYIDVMAVDPDLAPHLRRLYGGVIASRFADRILDLLANGYQIEKLYTVTATQEGDNLVREAGFQLMPGKSLVPGRTAYEIALDEAGIERLKERSRRAIYHVRTDSRTED